MTRIGAHVSSAGGCSRAFARALEIEAEAVQVFLSAPQRWKEPVIPPAEAEAFRRERVGAGIPAFAHAIYLVNLASGDTALVRRSVDSLAVSLGLCNQLGIRGLIFHVGSHLGAGFDAILPGVGTAVAEVLAAAPGDALLLLENNAGQGGGVGGTFTELGAIIRAAGSHPRLGVCIDTCHAFAMGYDLANAEGVAAMMDEFDREVGRERLAAVHANDSKTPLGGVRDRHENIGDGHVGLDGFAAVLAHPAFADATFLLEVPGLAGNGPDLENVRRLKAIRAGIRAARR